MPFHIVGQKAQEHVRFHMVLGAVMDGTDAEVESLEAAERLFDLFQALVAPDCIGGAQVGFAGAYHGYRPMIQRVEKQFGQLLWLARKLPEYRYRFSLLHQFKEYEKAVWVMPSGRKTKLIV